jgi:translation initiation factor IF-1
MIRVGPKGQLCALFRSMGMGYMVFPFLDVGQHPLLQRIPLYGLSYMAEDYIQTEGKIVAVLAGTMFRVELANQHVVLAHISGKMRKRFIRLTNGDRVKLEMSPYDLDKARITYRLG